MKLSVTLAVSVVAGMGMVVFNSSVLHHHVIHNSCNTEEYLRTVLTDLGVSKENQGGGRPLPGGNRERITVEQTEKASDFDDPCELEMLRIHQRNDCLRSHGNVNCSTAAPLHLHAWYHGQGFGRILHHSIETCLFAAILERPCVIDIDVRDKYYTWRSFINAGEYNWDWKIVMKSQENITDAYKRLPSASSDEWKGDSLKNLPDYDDVLPMVWHDDWESKGRYQKHLAYWHGNNKENRNKILLSPNFGFAWWYSKGIQYEKEIQKRTPGCTLNSLKTRLQNAMYAPTTLAKEVLRHRMEHTPAVVGHTNKTLAKVVAPKYGAIHLRSTKSNLQKTYYDNDEAVNLLRNCLLSEEIKDIQSWWLVSDNLTAADFIESRMPRVHTDYQTTHQSAQLRNQNEINLHSGHQMKQKFSHEYISPSIEDFMVMHESTVAIVTHGAFGETGARGNGKSRIKECRIKGTEFKVYRKQTE